MEGIIERWTDRSTGCLDGTIQGKTNRWINEWNNRKMNG